jgi:hypothetical protein
MSASSTDHPVSLRLERSPYPERLHVLIRAVLLLAVCAVFARYPVAGILYLAVPALVALRIAQVGGDGYLRAEGPRLSRGLNWVTGAFAYLWLLTDALPTRQGQAGPVELHIEPTGQPTPGSALLRLLTSLPALLLLALLSAVVGLVWFVAAILVLVGRWMPAPLWEVMAFVLRFQTRLFAYHLSLVDRYPSFGESSSPAHAAGSSAA